MLQVIIIMGSGSDREHCVKIVSALKNFGISSIMHVASAHKAPLKALEIIRRYENNPIVFITVAGRSNALSGFVDANTYRPVIACPPYGDKFSGADLFSSIRMPSGVGPMLVLEPEEAALATVKILALHDVRIAESVISYQNNKRMEIELSDENINEECFS